MTLTKSGRSIEPHMPSLIASGCNHVHDVSGATSHVKKRHGTYQGFVHIRLIHGSSDPFEDVGARSLNFNKGQEFLDEVVVLNDGDLVVHVESKFSAIGLEVVFRVCVRSVAVEGLCW